MKLLTSRLVAALAAASVLAAVPLSAARETPKDMFVMATLLDEFTTLDPGEIYELVPRNTSRTRTTGSCASICAIRRNSTATSPSRGR